jgi:hypothetical protein
LVEKHFLSMSKSIYSAVSQHLESFQSVPDKRSNAASAKKSDGGKDQYSHGVGPLSIVVASAQRHAGVKSPIACYDNEGKFDDQGSGHFQNASVIRTQQGEHVIAQSGGNTAVKLKTNEPSFEQVTATPALNDLTPSYSMFLS